MANSNVNHRSIIIRDERHEQFISRGFKIVHRCYEDSDDDDDDYTYNDYDIEDEDEQIKEEMTPPKIVTSEDGKKYLVAVFKHDWSTLGQRKTRPSAFDHDCSICHQPFSTAGDHRVCSLPCGHMYGMSCINGLLQLSQSSGKCPTCNTLCTLKDVRLLYPARTNPTLIKVSTKHFPFTKEGLRDFKHYALKRRTDALKLRTTTLERKTVVVDCMVDVLKRKMNDEMSLRALCQRAIENPDEALEHQIDTLQQSVSALDREADAFGCRADALRRRADILKWRAKACKASMYFFEERYNEHMGWVRGKKKRRLE